MVRWYPDSAGAREAVVSRFREFNKCHAPGGREDGGQFCPTDGAASAGAGTPRQQPVQVATVEEAIELLLQGQDVEVAEISQVNTMLDRLAAMALDAAAKGEAAPNYDLCRVSVAATNLFCTGRMRSVQYPNGIPRIEMPQIEGVPIPGSPADALPKRNGRVDGTDDFLNMLAAMGIGVQRGQTAAATLKASQGELVGRKVAQMMTDATYDPALVPIFVTRDHYVVDGHHRWASVVGRDAKDGNLGNTLMNTYTIDAPASEVVRLSQRWTKEFGMRGAAGPNPPAKGTR